jgi:hypothetical protein
VFYILDSFRVWRSKKIESAEGATFDYTADGNAGSAGLGFLTFTLTTA